LNLITNIDSNDVGNTDVTALILKATKQLNSDINVQVIRENIDYIDNTRQNKRDSSNTTYYVKNWKGKFLADMDNDGEITKDDIIFYQVTSDGTETELTVSSVDDDACSITLSSAPSPSNTYYITYAYSRVRQLADSVDSKVNLASIFLTAAYCYAKLNIGCAPSVSFGSTKITKDMQSFSHYYQRYLDMVNQINSLEEIHSKVSEDTF